ncbi:hypothetical protein [Stutzerimonas nitrititolerans]|uniref:hypothetical protein n=1 Tax=Stutzerimonas nitrititolerans TaxID=2482751 RepID=UPI003AA7F4B2
MARLYHRDQAGAPELAYSTAFSVATHFAALKIILKACLVYGYGAVPAAGWELTYESDRSLILRTGTRSGYVCFFIPGSSGYAVEVWLAATFDGVDAVGKIRGVGARSGTAANSALPQRFSVVPLAYHSSATTWAMVADEGTAVISLNGHPAPTPAEVNSSSVGNQAYCNFTLYCGDDSEGDLIFVGGMNGTSTSPSLSFSSSGFTALKHPGSGMLVDVGAISVVTPGLITSPAFHTDLGGVVLPHAYLQPVAWISGGVSRLLRGIAVDARVTHAYSSHISQAFGGPPLTTRSMNTVLTLGDGHDYLVGRSFHSHSISTLLTTNPEFW